MDNDLTPFALVTDNETGAEYLARFDRVADRDAFVITIGRAGFVARVTTDYPRDMQGFKWVPVTLGLSRLNGNLLGIPKRFPSGHYAETLCNDFEAIALPIPTRVET